MLEIESSALAFGRRVSSLMVARSIVLAHLDKDLIRQAGVEVRRSHTNPQQRMQSKGWRSVNIRLSGGDVLRMKTPYYRPRNMTPRGRPRGTGKRGVSGVGAYSLLEYLGIRDNVTPVTRSMVCQSIVLCDSYQESQEQLRQAGLELDISTVVRIAVATGTKALELRDTSLCEAINNPLTDHSPLAGERVRVSLDGGRARVRKTRRGRGIRPGKNGRRPFDNSWREPRVITVDVLDDEGKPKSSWRPIYEITMGNADATFALLTGLLRKLGVKQAKEVVFVSDGATWIWERLDKLIKETEIPVTRFLKILDYYHATEYVNDALKACKNLTSEQRKALFRKLKGELLQPNGAEEVIKQLRELARGRRAPEINKIVRYLKKHIDHMRYSDWRARSVPIGSGVVESAVRRVINLRFKSASMCWREDHLEPLLYLRAIQKSGRWDIFLKSFLNNNHWLDYSIPPQQAFNIDLPKAS